MTAEVTWIELRMPDSNRLIAKYDPFRGLLQVRNRGEEETFDLAEIGAQSAEGATMNERIEFEAVVSGLGFGPEANPTEIKISLRSTGSGTADAVALLEKYRFSTPPQDFRVTMQPLKPTPAAWEFSFDAGMTSFYNTRVSPNIHPPIEIDLLCSKLPAAAFPAAILTEAFGDLPQTFGITMTLERSDDEREN